MLTLRRFDWVSATRIQFNKKGTLVMVSGVLKQNIHKARAGEIIVYEARGEDAGDVTSRISLKWVEIETFYLLLSIISL